MYHVVRKQLHDSNGLGWTAICLINNELVDWASIFRPTARSLFAVNVMCSDVCWRGSCKGAINHVTAIIKTSAGLLRDCCVAQRKTHSAFFVPYLIRNFTLVTCTGIRAPFIFFFSFLFFYFMFLIHIFLKGKYKIVSWIKNDTVNVCSAVDV